MTLCETLQINSSLIIVSYINMVFYVIVLSSVLETVAPLNFICLCVCLPVCPAFTAYISVTIGWILIKLGEKFGTLVQLIVLKFEHSAAKGNTTHKG